jgi:hypothetical protein
VLESQFFLKKKAQLASLIKVYVLIIEIILYELIPALLVPD